MHTYNIHTYIHSDTGKNAIEMEVEQPAELVTEVNDEDFQWCVCVCVCVCMCMCMYVLAIVSYIC